MKDRTGLLLPRLSLVMATLFWAGNFAVGRVIFNEISPVMLNFLRWTIGLLFLSCFAIDRFRVIAGALRAHVRWFSQMAICGVLYHILLYTALRSTTATNMSLIMGATPATILLISAWLHDTRPSIARVLIVSLSFVGVGVLVQGHLAAPNLGDLIGCVAMLLWAFYTVALGRCPVQFDGLVLTTAVSLAGVALMLPLAVVDVAINGMVTFDREVVLAVLYVGLFAAGLAFLFWNKGVEEMGSVQAGQFMNLVPVFGALFGVTLLHEPFTGRHAVAALLIVGGLTWSEVYSRVERTTEMLVAPRPASKSTRGSSL